MTESKTGSAVIKEVEGYDVLVVHIPMTRELAREEFPSRPFDSKATKLVESRYGGVGYDGGDLEMMMNKEGAKCRMCDAPTKKQFLVDGICPDCDGRAEVQGNDPRLPRPE